MSQKNYGQENQDFSNKDYNNKNDFKNDLKDAGKVMSDKVKSIGSNIKDNLKENFDDVQSRAEDFGETIKERGQYMTAQLKDRVQGNPWAYIGGAAIAALALGFLAGRRTSKHD
ncbi:MAG: DUF883 family protein [Deltaproteobacteria bacterium]|nr:DUF883 family protein [Deltaproteobacteria bacterium]